MARRILGIVAAVVLAAVGTGVLVLYVQGAEQRALAGERTVDVLVVQAPIKKGTTAEQLAGLVESSKIPAKVQAIDSVSSLDELDGKVAAVDLVVGEQLVATRFVEPAQLARTGSVDIPDGLQQVTLSLEPQRAVGGRLAPGDTVGVFISFAPFDLEGVILSDEEGNTAEVSKTPNTTHLTFHKVLVTNVQGEAAPAAEDDEDATTGPTPAPGGSYLITLAVDAAQAERIVFAAEFGLLWLSNEPGAAVEDGTEIRTRGNVYP
ncbi:MAG TPA: RcpC/CpaB family pilus assembly protein [Egibacteraceae bacterium]|jgi:pilus assembly protein CpaB|nr:RcpC/CpaB family pilus assembly protein [Egibacteraceae bacterium]